MDEGAAAAAAEAAEAAEAAAAPLTRLLEAEGTSSSSRAWRLTEGFSLHVRLWDVVETRSTSNEDVEAVVSMAIDEAKTLKKLDLFTKEYLHFIIG